MNFPLILTLNLTEGMTRQKGARWKRGEACVSNPRVKKHRLEAASVVRSKRQKTAAEPEGEGLGVALKNLDENTDNLMNDDEVTHISGWYLVMKSFDFTHAAPF